MKLLRKEKGLSVWGIMIVLAMVGYIGMQAFALFTPAFNYKTMMSILDDMEAGQSFIGQPSSAVATSIQKKAGFNNVNGFSVKNKEQFQIKKKKKVYEVSVSYEQKAHLFGPLFMSLDLKRTIEIKHK